MIDILALSQTAEHFSNKEGQPIKNEDNSVTTRTIVIIVLGLIICFGTAYLAYSCNQYETPATRAIYTLFAFFFSGIYLVYYFVYHVILGKKCDSGKNIINIVRNQTKK